MTDWKDFFQNYRIVDIQTDNDLLFQVGTTVGGKPISPEQFRVMVDSIITGLELKKNDALLELCCGNGVITRELAKHAGHVTAVDVSAPYIENAKKFKSGENIIYGCCDAEDGAAMAELAGGRTFSKISLYASLAYFTPASLDRVMTHLSSLSPGPSVFMIGGVLDKGKKWNFFNTWGRKINYIFKYWLWGRDFGLGRWWKKSEIAAIAARYGYVAAFREQAPVLHTAHYRFDAILTRK